MLGHQCPGQDNDEDPECRDPSSGIPGGIDDQEEDEACEKHCVDDGRRIFVREEGAQRPGAFSAHAVLQ